MYVRAVFCQAAKILLHWQSQHKPIEGAKVMANNKDNAKGLLIAGVVVILTGLVFILREFTDFDFFDQMGNLWPFMIVIVGAFILWGAKDAFKK